MNQQEQEFLQTLKQCQKMHWIQSKQLPNLKIFYTGTNSFYQRGDIVFDFLLPLNSSLDERVQYFRIGKEQLSDGSLIERCKFKNQIYSLKYKYHYFKINESTQGIHRKYDDWIMVQQLVFYKVEKSRTTLTILQHLKSQPNYSFLKFLRECIINYSSLQVAELFEKQSIQSELRLDEDEEELNKYVCNYNDTNEFQPKETDEKYINEHYRYDIFLLNDRVTQLDQEDQDIYYKLFQIVSEYKLSNGSLQEGVIIAICNFRFDINASYAAIMNWIEWRRQHRINRLSAKQFPEFKGILDIVGESKCGRQVVYTKQSKLQPDKIDLERYKWYFIGFLEDVCRSCKGFVDSYITILDVDGFGFSNFDLQMTKSLLNMVLQFFPERQNKVFIINMSGFVMGFYKMLKPFLPTRTNDKLIFLGKDKQEIQKTLIEHLGFSIDFE
ncbi:unnamed protein product (macronuclear) [Paramecium tetraurelia]|uniref:CRAL-TRIO domain-containing protein n=1 Tax=Paramecium tetraurelia TaxID=5888 RepID=A0BJ68_PARTE|nr:uncharacterized protein GSPATT00004958001 [Paramecium tetraurelia]CAK58585.1 unnamed protein product [Paramecium tetraurelia]|eukprot:XP_001425983.1 hypothetical protein (macronuclear) [Paramecium tetraurelia strain d4-2]